ncbi:cupin domain-containing protein [Myxococcus sp. K15C18031901]|uniref:cupin domain-containing protein n=1 Tax=Myxococcus dinghuensis TaxID=2906761 RepID=UPI0020A7A9AE|nr:cupin domain-containing protein [Myxococcus dinghuensis]MCP3099804.1 cupin domain-containing protein [Myxococcus dinghuensis]
MEHLDDSLAEWALGTLESPDREAAERHLSSCARCRGLADRLAIAREGLSLLDAPVEPPPVVLERLLVRMEGPRRLERFADRLAAFFDLTRERTLALLDALGDASLWMPGPVEGTSLLPVEAGPGREGMLAAILRLDPGARYPLHTHHGRELNLVLEGGFREDGGHEVWPGEELEKTDGSAHGFTALEGPACLCASLLDGATRFDEELASPA